MNQAQTLLLMPCIPLLAAIAILICRRYPNLRDGIPVLAGGILVILCLSLLDEVMAAGPLGTPIILAQPLAGLSLTIQASPLGLMFILMAASLWVLTSIYSIGYMRAHHEGHQTRFYAFFALSMVAVIGLALAGDLLMLFLCYELLTLSTYPLVTHRQTDEARRGGRRYLGWLMGSSIGLLLPAMVLTYWLSGTLSFAAGGILAAHLPAQYVIPLLLLFVLGVGKAAVMPIHSWLPNAMVAPTPVSALLHAVAVVKAGIFTLLQVVLFIFGADLIRDAGGHGYLVWMPALTILLASCIALTRDNFKERLAYSTISQLSYMVLGILLANPIALLGAALHMVMHATAKISLFFVAGSVMVTQHKTRVSELAGLGRRMPISFAVYTLGCLSIIGLPLFGGMWSKWYLALGSIDGGHWSLVAVLMLSSLLNIGYLLQVSAIAYFRPAVEGKATIKEAPLSMLLPMVLVAGACIWQFFYADGLFNLAKQGVLP